MLIIVIISFVPIKSDIIDRDFTEYLKEVIYRSLF